MSEVDVRKEHDVYTVYLDGVYLCTCENMKEVGEVLEDIERRKADAT